MKDLLPPKHLQSKVAEMMQEQRWQRSILRFSNSFYRLKGNKLSTHLLRHELSAVFASLLDDAATG